MIFTIIGVKGFIGQALYRWLSDRGHEVHTPERHISLTELSANLRGHVIYCIGLTADFRKRPWDTVDAHVGVLRYLLMEKNFNSFTYLSSTRVYLGSKSGHEESPLIVLPEDPDHLYNLSKLLGESMCHAANHIKKPVRVIRLSNVVGGDLSSDNFIYSLLREALTTGYMQLKSSLNSAKDYISINDVIQIIELIACQGRANCYNLASGKQTSHEEIVNRISKITGAIVKTNEIKSIQFPVIDICRIKEEFNFNPSPILNELDLLCMDNSLIRRN